MSREVRRRVWTHTSNVIPASRTLLNSTYGTVNSASFARRLSLACGLAWILLVYNWDPIDLRHCLFLQACRWHAFGQCKRPQRVLTIHYRTCSVWIPRDKYHLLLQPQPPMPWVWQYRRSWWEAWVGRFEIIIWPRTSSVGLGGAWDNASSSGSGLKISVCLPPGGSRTRRDGTIVSRSEAGIHGVLCESETVALNSETYQKLLPARQRWQQRRSVCQISRILSAKVLTSAP